MRYVVPARRALTTIHTPPDLGFRRSSRHGILAGNSGTGRRVNATRSLSPSPLGNDEGASA